MVHCALSWRVDQATNLTRTQAGAAPAAGPDLANGPQPPEESRRADCKSSRLALRPRPAGVYVEFLPGGEMRIDGEVREDSQPVPPTEMIAPPTPKRSRARRAPLI